jgi:hypothetical protein
MSKFEPIGTGRSEAGRHADTIGTYDPEGRNKSAVLQVR